MTSQSGIHLCGHLSSPGELRYARRVNDSDRPPWVEAPAATVVGRAIGGRAAETASAPWADPPELISLRAEIGAAQGRIDRATRQLELAAELEARLRALLEGRSGRGVPPVPSPGRQAAELEATAIILRAELRAAKILNDTGNPEGGGSYRPTTIELDAARALEGHLAQLADIEATLAAIARQLVQNGISGKPGPSRLALDGTSERRRSRPGQSVPVPLFRRPPRGNPG
jgi:hypothetical protein